MTEKEIKICLERMTMGKTSDVMNFDYAGTLEYIKRLEAENAELKARLEKSVELPKPEIYPTFYGMVVKWYTVEEHKELHYSPKEAEVHFAKLKGGENG